MYLSKSQPSVVFMHFFKACKNLSCKPWILTHKCLKYPLKCQTPWIWCYPPPTWNPDSDFMTKWQMINQYRIKNPLFKIYTNGHRLLCMAWGFLLLIIYAMFLFSGKVSSLHVNIISHFNSAIVLSFLIFFFVPCSERVNKV